MRTAHRRSAYRTPLSSLRPRDSRSGQRQTPSHELPPHESVGSRRAAQHAILQHVGGPFSPSGTAHGPRRYRELSTPSAKRHPCGLTRHALFARQDARAARWLRGRCGGSRPAPNETQRFPKLPAQVSIPGVVRFTTSGRITRSCASSSVANCSKPGSTAQSHLVRRQRAAPAHNVARGNSRPNGRHAERAACSLVRSAHNAKCWNQYSR